MSSKQIASHREGAEIYHGAALCKQKVHEIMDNFHLPKHLVPLNNLVEAGYNRTTGFLWLKQERASKYWFKDVGTILYGLEITAFMENRRMQKLTGIKSKGMVISLNISDISVGGGTNTNKIIVTTSTGISKNFPMTAFDDEPKEIK